MSRQLRPRGSRPSYAGLDLEDDEAGPSVAIVEDEASCGSDFEPEKDKKAEDSEEDEVEEEKVEEEEIDLDTEEADELPDVSGHRRASSAIVVSKAPLKEEGKGKSKMHVVKSISAPGVNLTRTSRRHMNVLPTPSVHHRYRAVPLFSRRGRMK